MSNNPEEQFFPAQEDVLPEDRLLANTQGRSFIPEVYDYRSVTEEELADPYLAELHKTMVRRQGQSMINWGTIMKKLPKLKALTKSLLTHAIHDSENVWFTSVAAGDNECYATLLPPSAIPDGEGVVIKYCMKGENGNDHETFLSAAEYKFLYYAYCPEQDSDGALAYLRNNQSAVATTIQQTEQFKMSKELFRLLAVAPQHVFTPDKVMGVTPSPVIIDNLARAGELMQIAAGAKEKKTWSLLHLLDCALRGNKWLNKFEVTKSFVVYIDTELIPNVMADSHQYEITNRLNKYFRINSNTVKEGYVILPLRAMIADGQKFDLAALVTFLELKLTEYKNQADKLGLPLLVIIDPLQPLLQFVGSANKFDNIENNNGAMADFGGRLQRLANRTRAAVVIAHHTAKQGNGKNNGSASEAGRGASAFGGATSTNISFTRDKEGMILFKADTRSFKPIKPFKFNLNINSVSSSVGTFEVEVEELDNLSALSANELAPMFRSQLSTYPATFNKKFISDELSKFSSGINRKLLDDVVSLLTLTGDIVDKSKSNGSGKTLYKYGKKITTEVEEE